MDCFFRFLGCISEFGVRGRSRQFWVASSGFGKTFVCKYSSRFVDADTIFTFPRVDNWWMNTDLARRTDRANANIANSWLAGPNDGRILLYASDLGGLVHVDRVLILDFITLYGQLGYVRPGQPSRQDWNMIRDGISDSVRKYNRITVHLSHNFFIFILDRSQTIDWMIDQYSQLISEF